MGRKGTKGDIEMSENKEGQNQSTNMKGGQKKGFVVLLAVAGVIIVLLLVVVIVLLIKQGNVTTQQEEKRNVIVTQDNVEEVIEQMAEEEVLPVSYYTVTMTPEWRFSSGDAVSENAYVANAIENSSDVYFDIFVSGDEENAIYKSPIIPRGGELEQIALDQKLDKGEYDCVCIYHLVDEDQNTLSTLRVTLKIIVEN